MKKKLSVAVAVLLSGSLLFSSCMGSFSLTKKMYEINQSFGEKWVNEIVFAAFCILPVYEITLLVDGLVINSIEFWSGSNPLADNVKNIKGENGEYTVASHEKGYTITDTATNETVEFTYNSEDNSWAVDGTTFLTFVDENHVSVLAADGQMVTVENSEAGLMAYKSMANSFMADK